MIKYLGSKRRLVPLLVDVILGLGDVRVVVDLFSGSARVGQALKARGCRVIANDHTAFAATLARGAIEADDDVAAAADRLIAELNALPGEEGWFTARYARQARFFQPENSARIEAIRRRIATLDVAPTLEAVLLTSLLQAADRVDSTCGVQMAFLKQWSARSANPLWLRRPTLWPRSPHGPGRALCDDAVAAATRLAVELDADVVYLDPPYNRHSYLGNYHLWETLVRFDDPEVYGLARKRREVQTKKSRFNRRDAFVDAFTDVVDRLRTRHIVVSYSNEGAVAADDVVAVLARRGPVRRVAAVEHPRYVGAKIGQHNPRGERIAAPTHIDNVEYVFVVDVQTPPRP
jgi:adenine-specific DNA-methyltransferase